MTAQVEVVAVPEKGRYEILVAGDVAGFVSYRVREAAADGPDTWVFDSTEVDPAYRGQGLAGRLVQAAADDVRNRGVYVEPKCSYVVAWFDKHPDYRDLLDPEYAARH